MTDSGPELVREDRESPDDQVLKEALEDIQERIRYSISYRDRLNQELKNLEAAKRGLENAIRILNEKG
jgi:hypothetical protein